jgi:hypothetical protein
MINHHFIYVLLSFLVFGQPGSAAELLPRYFHGTGDISDIDQSGSLVAVADGYGVELLDSSTGGFVHLAHLDFDAVAQQVVIHGDVLYVGVIGRGLYAVDISAPTAPVVHGLALTSGGWKELEVTGDVAVGFTTGWGWNIFTGDLTDPLNPVAADSLALENGQSGFALGDDHFYFTSSNDKLQTWSVADPYNPVQTGHYDTGNPRWTRLTVSGDLLWAHGLDLTAFSLTNPGVPTPVSQVADNLLLFPVATSFGSMLYRSLSADPTDLVVYDYSDPSSPAVVNTLDGIMTSSLGAKLHAEAGELLVANWNTLTRYDLTDPSAPMLGTSTALEDVLDLAGDGSLAWFASGLAGLSCLDASPPFGSPVWRGPWPQQGEVTRVAANENRVALVDGSGVRLLDVSSPEAPSEVLAIAAEATAVDLEGNTLVFTAGEALHVVDLAGDMTPVSVPLGGAATGVLLARSHAYVLNPTDLVTIVDLGDLSSPQVIGPVVLPDFVPEPSFMDLSADGNLLVVSVYGRADNVFDITDPANPVLLSQFLVDLGHLSQLTLSVSLQGRWLLVGTGGTAHLVDMYDPLHPVDVTGPAYASSNVVAWLDGQVAVTGGMMGAVLFDLETAGLSAAPLPVNPGLDLSLTPNPANPRVTVAWDLPRPGPVQVEVFDLAGRRIAGLVNERRGQGPGSAAWDGKDDSGRGVASGVYMVRVRTETAVESRPVTLVR